MQPDTLNRRSLSLSSMPTNTDTFANSVDQDETARHEPSHQNLHYLPVLIDFDWNLSSKMVD